MQNIPLQNISVIVLAAGTSSRMNGTNKLLRPFGISTVIEETLKTYISCGFGEVLCITGRDAEEVGLRSKALRAKTLHNLDFMLGMAHSIVLGVANISPQSKGILIALGDMPFVSKVSIDELWCNFIQEPKTAICIPTFNRQRGNPVLFSIAYKQDLMQLSGDVGAKSIVKRYEHYCREVPMPDDSCLRDLDTEEDFVQNFG
jgi:molybdenum cofactor cytidylyltransferase